MTLNSIFHLDERKTTVGRELMAGTVIFFTMAYILAVNPSILGDAGMDSTAVLIATAIASAIGSTLMGLLANLPFALSAGMGLNAYFAYSVVIGLGYDWEKALLAVFVEGIIFIILSISGIREAIYNAIPRTLRSGVSVAIGLFIAFIGLQNAGVCISNPSTLVERASFTADFSTSGITICLALVGVLLIGIMLALKVPGAMLIGIMATWGLGIICQLAGIYTPNVETGFYSLFPQLSAPDLGAIGLTFGKCFKAWGEMSWADAPQFATVVLSFLFVDIFDTLGTLMGCATAAGDEILDEDGELPRIKWAMLADAVATLLGAILGTSTVTTYVESASGVKSGGRTGLTALTTAGWFVLSIFAAPVFISIPSFATAPALVVVGGMMLSSISSIKKEDMNDYSELIPVFLCVAAMPFFYSIAEGIAFGIISYVVINTVGGLILSLIDDYPDNRGWKMLSKVNPVMVVLAVVFVLKYAFL